MSVSYEYLSNTFYNRVGMTYFKLGGYHYLVGGRQDDSAGTPGTCFNDVWKSADGCDWTCIQASADFTARVYCLGLVYNEYMYLIGGLNQGATSNFAEVWKSNDGITWTRCTNAPGWAAMHAMDGVVINGKMFVLGGQGAPNAAGWGYAIFSSSDGATWTYEKDGAYGGREYSCTQVIGSTAYLYAGKTSPTGAMSGDCWSSSNGKDWTKIATAAFTAHYGERGAVYNNALYALCGRKTMDAVPGSLNNQGFYSAAGVTWTELATQINLIGYHCLAVQDDYIYILGGYYNGISRLNMNYTTPVFSSDKMGGILC